MLVFKNNGQAIVSTNYWQSEQAAAGLFFLSWNAAAGRVLVPRLQVDAGALREMASAASVIVSAGPWVEQGGRAAVELLWEDGSEAPFCVHLVAEQTDRWLPAADQGGGFVVTAWSEDGEQGRWPGCFRRVAEIPCLEPWVAH